MSGYSLDLTTGPSNLLFFFWIQSQFEVFFNFETEAGTWFFFF